MRYQPGDFVRAVHPSTMRMVVALVIGVRGRTMEYHVSDGDEDWFTYMVRALVQAEPSKPKDRQNIRLRCD